MGETEKTREPPKLPAAYDPTSLDERIALALEAIAKGIHNPLDEMSDLDVTDHLDDLNSTMTGILGVLKSIAESLKLMAHQL